MQQVEGTRITQEDRRELEQQIDNLEKEIEESNDEWYPKMAPETPRKIKELRRLRRMRQP